MILSKGGASIDDEKIDIQSFCIKFMKALKRRANNTSILRAKLIQKLYSILKSKDIAVFDLIVKLDRNLNSKLSKVELKTGLQSLGL